MATQTINLEKQEHPNLAKRWLSPSEVEAEYGFSKSWQSKARMVGSGINFPFSKIGKFVRSDRVAIDKWLEEHQVQGSI